MKFEKYLNNHKKITQEAIGEIFSFWQKDISKKTDNLKELTKLLATSNKGGKYFRSTLIHLGYDLYAKNDSQEVNQIAAGYEILHTSLLIHDDIFDKSLLRRGEKTVFQKLGGDHYGISQAICLGDIGFFLATKALIQSKFSDTIKTQIVTYFSQLMLDTIAGEMLDIKFAKQLVRNSDKNVITIARLKTAHYSISGPLILGALLAGVKENKQKKLAYFGDNLGIAYQIKDDILGVFGDQFVLGKSVTSDIEEGKNTLLFIKALANASDKHKKFLLKYYGKGKITQEQHEQIKKIFIETGALVYTEKRANDYKEKAQNMISQITTNERQRILLNDFLTFLTERKK